MFGKDLVVADRSANPGSVALSCESTLDAGDPPVIPSKKDASSNQSQQCARKKACQDSGADDQKKETVFMEGQSATRCNGHSRSIETLRYNRRPASTGLGRKLIKAGKTIVRQSTEAQTP